MTPQHPEWYRVELRDGPDYGRVYEVPPSRESMWSLLAQLSGAVMVIMIPITWLAFAVTAR